MKSVSFNAAILSFLSRYGLYFHHTKNQPRMRPTSTFFNIGLNFGHICFQKMQKMQNILFGGYIEWKISVYFCPLFVLFKPHWPS